MSASYQQWNQPATGYMPHHPQLEHEFAYPRDAGHRQTADFHPSFQFNGNPFQSSNYTTPPTSFTPTYPNGAHSNVQTSYNSSPSSPETAYDHFRRNQSTAFDGDPAFVQRQATFNRAQTGYDISSAVTLPSPDVVSSTDATRMNGYYTTSQSQLQDTFSRPPASKQAFQHQSYCPPGVATQPIGSPLKTKRPRPEPNDDGREDDADQEMAVEHRDKIKPGACQRCKNLKVRCEFKTDTDPCKRCLNGGHECVIPGRKKRRTPPKREHLLNQIREQADQIQRLMAKLEEVNKRQTEAEAEQSSPFDVLRSASPHSLHSPVLSPTSTHASYLSSESPAPGVVSRKASAEQTKAVEDWIAKARESLNEFGGFIEMSTAGVPKKYIVEHDPEDSSEDSSESEAETGNEQEYDISVISGDEDDEDWQEVGKRKSRLSSSSAGSHRTKKVSTSTANDKLASLPSEAAPFGLMAELSLRKTRKRGTGGTVEDDDDDIKDSKELGVANDNFFRSSPAPDPRRARIDTGPQVPYVLARGIISPAEAEALFNIFFDYMNISASLVDPVLYTAQKTFYRSPFLFTVICAIASRFYTRRPELYNQAMHYAQLAAGTALISGPKNVELCIGYILLSLWPVPAKRWEDQRGWLYLGLAIRIANDINLHLPATAKPLSENHAREQLNRTRVWLNCFNLDRSTGSQYGKKPIIPNIDYMSSHSENWWKSSPYNMVHWDIHLCCYNAELRVMAGFIDRLYSDPNHPTNLNKEIDFEQLATQADEALQELQRKWFAILDQTDQTNPQNRFRTGLLRLAYSYARLIALSFGFQHAFGKTDSDENPFFTRCLAAATDVVNTVVSDIGRPEQRIYVRHGPEAQSVFVTFAASFLIKSLQPKFAAYVSYEKAAEIRRLVRSVIDHLSSPEIALDNQHGPNLYAQFLKGLLNAPMAKKIRRSKSASGDSHELTPSPASTTKSLSPPPSSAAMSFDQFAPAGGVSDPFAPVNAPSDTTVTEQSVSISAPMDFFQPPLPFDNEILRSMQSLSDPSVWQDIALPDYDWMAQFQPSVAQMGPTAATMYQVHHQQYMVDSSQQ